MRGAKQCEIRHRAECGAIWVFSRFVYCSRGRSALLRNGAGAVRRSDESYTVGCGQVANATWRRDSVAADNAIDFVAD